MIEDFSRAFWQGASPLTDSRKQVDIQKHIFFALPGGYRHGSDFVGELYNRGLRCFVVPEGFDSLPYPQAEFIFTAQPLRLLQAWAAWQRGQFGHFVLGITGSNAKTIVKESLYQMLSPCARVYQSPKSYNSQLGVALSLLGLDLQAELALIEAGISEAGEMQHLQKMLSPDYGIFTNIGEAHSQGFASLEEKLKEKLRLFAGAQELIYCKDQGLVAQAIEENWAWEEGQRPKHCFSWGKSPAADLQYRAQRLGQETLYTLRYDGQELRFILPFVHRAALENSMHCIVFLLRRGYSADYIQEQVSSLRDLPMRLSLMQGLWNCRLIDDSYSNDLAGLESALDFMEHKAPRRGLTGHLRCLILSDIVQSALGIEQIYRQVAEQMKVYGVSRIVGVGLEIGQARACFAAWPQSSFWGSTQDLIEAIDRGQLQFENETILLKGARHFAFERISRRLRRQTHDTVLEINLSAVLHNLNSYRALLKPQIKLMVMVKASAYGGGSVELARLLAHQGVDYLGVAYIDEGIRLREEGIRIPIFVMNAEPVGFAALRQYDLEPVVYSLSHLRKLLASAEALPLKIHIELDTGMNRLGFKAEQLPELMELLLAQKAHLQVASCFTHLAVADEPSERAFTLEQLARFERGAALLAQYLDYPFLRHALNSAGITAYSQAQYDMVRLGIGLHGIDPNSKIQSSLRPVAQLKTHISQIHELQAGESIGYGRKGRMTEAGRVGVLAIGYADGFSRRLSRGRGQVLIRGQLVPTIGNICMDMSFVDLSQLPQAKEGDSVLIFGEGLPVERQAQNLDTIAYELLTSISGRVPRIFYED